MADRLLRQCLQCWRHPTAKEAAQAGKMSASQRKQGGKRIDGCPQQKTYAPPGYAIFAAQAREKWIAVHLEEAERHGESEHDERNRCHPSKQRLRPERVEHRGDRREEEAASQEHHEVSQLEHDVSNNGGVAQGDELLCKMQLRQRG